MDKDKIIRAYTRLVALKQNLPSIPLRYVHEKYVKEYHEIIDVLSSEVNIPLDEFKVPAIEIKQGGGIPGAEYPPDRYCERALLLSKLDALLSYFQINHPSEEKTEIGFKPPKK